MQVTTVRLDLAKNIFHVHGVTETGEVAFNRPLRRAQVLAFFERLSPCLIGVEACASSHHWGRELTKLGHTVRLMPPMYVKPYVKRGKSDAVDAEAICEAVTRPTMRFVEIKSEDQQALLSLHRARDFVVRQRTQLINMLRSLAAEFGIAIARGLAWAIDFAKGLFPDILRTVGCAKTRTFVSPAITTVFAPRLLAGGLCPVCGRRSRLSYRFHHRSSGVIQRRASVAILTASPARTVPMIHRCTTAKEGRRTRKTAMLPAEIAIMAFTDTLIRI